MMSNLSTEIFERAHDGITAEFPSPQLMPGACPACALRTHRRNCYACHAEIIDSEAPSNSANVPLDPPQSSGEVFLVQC